MTKIKARLKLVKRRRKILNQTKRKKCDEIISDYLKGILAFFIRITRFF